MTPHLTGALEQLPSLTGPELTILAAAAQALAASAHHLAPPAPPAEQPPDPPSTRVGPGPRRRGSARTGTEQISHLIPPAGLAGANVLSAPGPAGRAPPGPGGLDGGGCRLPGRGRGRCLDGVTPAVDPELFASVAYRRRLNPTVPGLLYAAGCDGVLALAEQLGEPVYKLGITEGRTTAMRTSTLAASRYAGVVRDDAGWREEEGFDHWRAVGLPLVRQRGRLSPVTPALRAIAYQRPVTLSHAALDRLVAAALAPASLDSVLASAAGEASCRGRGLDPGAFARYTPGPLGRPRGRPERARELVLLGPRADADRIAGALEEIIAAHVMGRDSA